MQRRCVSICPDLFEWNPDFRRCDSIFAQCYQETCPEGYNINSNGNCIGPGSASPSVNPGEECIDKWRQPVSQSDPYWRDILDADKDCFDIYTPNAQRACCPLEEIFNNKEHGAYEDIIVKKLPIESIGIEREL